MERRSIAGEWSKKNIFLCRFCNIRLNFKIQNRVVKEKKKRDELQKQKFFVELQIVLEEDFTELGFYSAECVFIRC